MNNIYIHAHAGICAIGDDAAVLRDTILSDVPPCAGAVSQAYSADKTVFLGAVAGTDSGDVCVIDDAHVFKNRNNALLDKVFAKMSAEFAQARQGIADDRIAIILGSSNAGIEEGENAVAHQVAHGTPPDTYAYEQQEYGSPAQFLARKLSVTGPAYVISTACSSGAKAFISAARLLQAGVCDLALVGGSDVLSQLTVNGFLSLDAVDGGRSQPFAAERKGIHLGEAAALFVLSKVPSEIRLLGWGESSDAHHMAAPQPDGLGAEASMRAALSHAGLTATDIDYVNLHGTATAQNDSMEAAAVARVFGADVPMSSTKALTGHTLGAAGAIEALFCCLTLSQRSAPTRLPVHWTDGDIDPALPRLNFVRPVQDSRARLRYVLSNSFGFGGSNASLIFEKVA
jgi:3-oxoacyl-[acyl-carrier-protein] synthase-1